MKPHAAITAPVLQAALKRYANPEKAKVLRGFFKTAPGQYGEGDVFLGVTVPQLRIVARRYGAASPGLIRTLLRSPIHEERLLALLIMIHRFEKGHNTERKRLHDLYLANTHRINNWDLVDLSAPRIVGAFLLTRSRRPLLRLAHSSSLWERRIAIVATHAFIRHNDLSDTFRIAGILLHDPDDLIHKAVGWMLREAGKRDPAAERRFLDRHSLTMPRTMLRYAIERFPSPLRAHYLRPPKRLGTA